MVTVRNYGRVRLMQIKLPKLRSFQVLWLAAAAVLMSVNPALAAGRIHLILVMDTDDPTAVGDDVEKDAANIKERFTDNVPSGQLSIKDLRGPNVTRENVLRTIRNLPVGPDDAIVFAYGGHGLFIAQAGNGERTGHALQFTHGRSNQQLVITLPGSALQLPPIDKARLLYRADLISELEAKRVRLRVVWTDCCNTNVKVELKTRQSDLAYSVEAGQFKSPLLVATPLFRSLFLQPKGLIDLATSAPGEMAWGKPPGQGGLATVEFCRFLTANKTKTMTWPQAFTQVQREISNAYRQDYPQGNPRSEYGLGVQKTQTLYRFDWRLGVAQKEKPPTPVNKKPLGVRVYNQLPGVLITEVTQNSPATKFKLPNGDTGYLEREDVVVKVNGRNVNSATEFATAIRTSPVQLSVVVLSRQDLSAKEKPSLISATTTLDETRKLGVTARDRPKGVRIGFVAPNSAASKAVLRQLDLVSPGGLKVGYVITAVNGRRTPTEQDFGRAMDSSGPILNLELAIGADPVKFVTRIDLTK